MPTNELINDLSAEAAQQEVIGRLHRFQLDRRDLLKALGGGLLVSLAGVPALGQESGRRSGGHELPQDVSAWIHIGADGKVTVFTGKVEVGQNIRTSLAQSVAEELRVPFRAITMVMGDTDLTPWDMGTFGSRSTPTMGPQLRNMAVTARQMLVEAAAQRWSADASGLAAADGTGGRSEIGTVAFVLGRLREGKSWSEWFPVIRRLRRRWSGRSPGRRSPK